MEINSSVKLKNNWIISIRNAMTYFLEDRMKS
jgi:hypothetical protein